MCVQFLELDISVTDHSPVTSSVTYCNPPETLLIQRFEVAYFPANTSVSFNVSASSVVRIFCFFTCPNNDQIVGT